MLRRKKKQVKRGTKGQCRPAKQPAQRPARTWWVDEPAQLSARELEFVAHRDIRVLSTSPMARFAESNRLMWQRTRLQGLLLYAIAQGWTIEQLLDGDDVYPGGLRALFPGLQPVAHLEEPKQ